MRGSLEFSHYAPILGLEAKTPVYGLHRRGVFVSELYSGVFARSGGPVKWTSWLFKGVGPKAKKSKKYTKNTIFAETARNNLDLLL